MAEANDVQYGKKMINEPAQNYIKLDPIVNRPEIFYKKIKRKDEIMYIFQSDNVLEYIKKYSTHDEFIILSFIGKSQYGKSRLSENMTGIKHEIGNSYVSETEGATIAYGGTIREIYERMKIEPFNNNDDKIDVFIIDTEGINDDLNKNLFAPFIINLLIHSTKIVSFMSPEPDDFMNNFLSAIKSFIIFDDNGNKIDPFQNKLILRIKDFPHSVEKNAEYYSQLFKDYSVISKNFHDQSIYPIYAPGGPYNYNLNDHDKIFTKFFLDATFASFLNQTEKHTLKTYTNPEDFLNNILNSINHQTKSQYI